MNPVKSISQVDLLHAEISATQGEPRLLDCETDEPTWCVDFCRSVVDGDLLQRWKVAKYKYFVT